LGIWDEEIICRKKKRHCLAMVEKSKRVKKCSVFHFNKDGTERLLNEKEKKELGTILPPFRQSHKKKKVGARMRYN
jgi:hypothetical protein